MQFSFTIGGIFIQGGIDASFHYSGSGGFWLDWAICNSAWGYDNPYPFTLKEHWGWIKQAYQKSTFKPYGMTQDELDEFNSIPF